ncbi:MAG: flagellin [Candidatus Thermoplasmatota archaeon]
MYRGVTLFQRGARLSDTNASIGLGSLIIFIAMILVAGIAASVIIETMNDLQNTAMETGQETMRDVSNGIKVTHYTGFNNGSKITQLAIFVSPTAGSQGIDLSYSRVVLRDSNNQLVLSYNSDCFCENVDGLFGSINSSNLTSTSFGLLVIQDPDGSVNSGNPVMNNNDLIVIIVNATKCFSGIETRTDITGKVIPESGIAGIISFTTPSCYIDQITDL